MEHPGHPRDNVRLHHEQPTTDPGTGGSASTGKRGDYIEDQTLRIPPPPVARTSNDDASSRTITFKDHHGESYIWPHELCRSYEVRTVVSNEFKY